MTSLARWARAALVAVLLATGLGAATGTAPAVAAPGLASDVHIFYYSWYGSPAVNGSYRHWQQGGFTPPQSVGANFYPALGAYDTGDYAGAVTRHLEWIARSGVGVIVFSWWGRDSYEDRLAQGVLDTANRFGIKVAWHLEPYAGRTAAS